MPKVSVIIPVYNVEKYLRQCLDSVVGQTLKDIEIICVDDGSPDNSSQIIDEYASKDERIVAIHKENGGYASAINKGLDIARGEFIGIVESDDYCSLDMYEKLYNKIKNSDADLITGDFYFLKGSTKLKKYDYEKDLQKDENGYFNVHLSPNVLTKVAYPWKSLYRKSFLDDNNIRMLQDGLGAYEDQPWNAEILSNAKKIMTLNEPVYFYRSDANGSSSNNGSRKLIKYIDRRKQAKDILIKNDCFSDDQKEYFYLSAYKGGRTFFRNIAKEYKEEYYNEIKKLFLQAYDEKITFKYFPAKTKRRYDRICKYSYKIYKSTYLFFEFCRCFKDFIKKGK